MSDYLLDPPSEPDGCPRWAAGDCDCPPGQCDIDEARTIRAAEDARDYPPTDEDAEVKW